MIAEKVKLFKALSDPNRLRILKMLQTKPLCVCEITYVLELAASTVSKHLSILKEVDFIKEKKEGKWVNYSINSNNTDGRVASILSSLDFWISDENLIIEDKKKILKVNREAVCGR
jgi:ArsR family transcriptional regulator, arsenate/arsenite/antimonite-responsive transcriptional repressor